MRLLLLLMASVLVLAGPPRPIRLSLNGIGTLNPLLVYTDDQFLALDLVFDRLVTLDAKGEFQPEILERWTLSGDQKEAILEVRKGLQWQDGHPLDAEDVLFTWKLMRSPAMKALADNQGVWIPAMEVVGPHTLKIRAREPMPTLLAELYNFYPVPRHAYGAVKDPAHHPFNWAPIGSGPYRVLPGASAHRVELVRWEGYRGLHPGLAPGFEFLSHDRGASAARGEPLARRFGALGVDFIGSTSWFQSLLVRRGAPGLEGFVALSTVQDGFEAAWINCDPRLSVLGDVRLRQAIANLLPWDEYARERQVRPVQVAMSLWHPLSWAADPAPKPLPRPELGASLLDAAGWRRGPSGWRQNSQGQDLVLVLYHGRPLIQDPFIRRYVEALMQAGIRVDARQVNTQRMQELQVAGTGDIWISAWVNNGPDPNGDRLLYTTEGIPSHVNYVRYSNAELDRLFEAGRHEPDLEARKEIYRRINRIIHRDRPLILLEHTPYHAVASKHLTGVGFSSRGNLYGFIPGMRGWRLED